MESTNKKGVSTTNTYSTDMNIHQTQSNYSRLSNLCLAIALIAIAVELIAYLKGSDSALMFGIGMSVPAVLIQFVLDPIEEDEDEY